jgi:selenophosphate synthase
MVGERGPELFVPRTSGMVVPNNNLADVTGGGGQTINNYNISAIDVKSFEERILGSSRAVWAANAYAGKSLAVAQGRA